jgi:hypothetical protein
LLFFFSGCLNGSERGGLIRASVLFEPSLVGLALMGFERGGLIRASVLFEPSLVELDLFVLKNPFFFKRVPLQNDVFIIS